MAAVLALATMATACATSPPGEAPRLASLGPGSESGAQLIGLIQAGRVTEAQAVIAERLDQAPEDARLHFLNGALYEQQAQGRTELLSLAEIGYRTAGRLDPALFAAHDRLGRLLLGARRYAAATDAFAEAVLVRPGDAAAWSSLAIAAYLARDLPTAYAAAATADRLAGRTADTEALTALIDAAVGRADAARAQLAAARASGLDDRRAAYLDGRLGDWRAVHAAGPQRVRYDAPPPPQAQADAALFNFPASPPASEPTTPPPQPMAPTATPAFSADPTFDGGGQDSAYYGPRVMRPIRPANPTHPRMVLVEAAILRTASTLAQSRGVNLLDGLAIQVGGSSEYTRQTAASGGLASQRTTTRILDGKISIANLTYSLNIANNAGERVEVVARPSLIALEGQPAQFFSGAEITVATTSTYGSGTLVPKPVGVGLSVTPTFLDDGTILLAVSAERDTLEADLPLGTFQEALRTARNTVTSNVMLRYDQTLVIGGLLDRERYETSSRTPLLGRVPGVQYLFGSKQAEQTERSLLIVLTIRDANTGPVQSAPISAAVAEALRRHAPQVVLPDTVLEITRALADAPGFADFRDADALVVPGARRREGLAEALLGVAYF